MTIRARRRAITARRLEDMTDSELIKIKFFGAIMKDPRTCLYDATPEEQIRAAEILKERKSDA